MSWKIWRYFTIIITIIIIIIIIIIISSSTLLLLLLLLSFVKTWPNSLRSYNSSQKYYNYDNNHLKG